MTEATDKKPRKTAVDAPRGTFFWLDPHDPRLKLVGVDVRTGQTKPDGPEHYLYDTRAFRTILPERVSNYRHYGVKTAIHIVIDGDDYLVEDGRGRLIGARLVADIQRAAGEEIIRIPAVVAKGDEVHLFGLSRALNVHDADDTLTNAKNAQRMLDMGSALATVAVTFGVSDQTIRNWTAMLSLSPEVMAEVVNGELSGTAAIQLASLPKAEQSKVLTEAKASGEKLTVEKMQRTVREKTGKPAGNTPKDRLGKIAAILTKLADKAPGERTKDVMADTLDKISRIATGCTLDKLADIGD